MELESVFLSNIRVEDWKKVVGSREPTVDSPADISYYQKYIK